MGFKQTLKDRLLPVLNAMLRPLSLRVVGRGDAYRTFRDFFRHVHEQGVRFNTVIDVGVAFGTPTLYDGNPGAKLFLIEPVPACAPHLEQLARRYGGTAFNVAAGASDGEIPFNIHADISGSSALKEESGPELDGVEQLVPVRRLDTLLAGRIEPPALLKIDTQGYELEVIEGARGILPQVEMIIAECSFHSFRIGAPEVGDVIARLGEAGFVPYETLGGYYRGVDGALAQLDIAFVREDSPLRDKKGAFTPAQLTAYLKRRA